jgi:anti-anti-sigma factor
MVSNPSRLLVQRGINETFITFNDRELLDEAVIKQLDQEIMGLVSEENLKNFLLDFSNVDFMSSSFLGLLVKLHKRVTEKKGQLKLCNIDKKIKKVFKITQLDKILNIDDK